MLLIIDEAGVFVLLMDVNSLPANVALARELAESSDYNSALTYYEMSLNFMAKWVVEAIMEY